MWVEALDQGDWNVSVLARDKVMRWQVPFDSLPEQLTCVKHRFEELVQIEDSNLAIT